MINNAPARRPDPHPTGLNPARHALIVLAVIAGLAGCASPPSLVPLLRGVQRGLIEERQYLAHDQQRSDQAAQIQLDSLHQAFLMDMRQREQLDMPWVTEHTQAYVLARDALLRQQMNHQSAYRQRQQNLDLAIAVQNRAIALIQQQDALLWQVPDLRRWLEDRAQGQTGATHYE